MSDQQPTPVTLTSIPVRVVEAPGYADEFNATLILEITRPTDGVHLSVVEFGPEGETETTAVPSVCVQKPFTTFDLFVTTKEGRTSKALNSPYPTRKETHRTVAMGVRGGPTVVTSTEAATFADSVISAPPGVPVTHGATGITFRTEHTEHTT